MADKKRVAITLQEKTLIFQRRQEHPEESWAVIANLFSVKWGRKITRSMACRFHKQIKGQKESGRELNAANMTRSRLVPAIIMKFEAELYEKINDRLLTNPMSFDTVKDAKAGLTFLYDHQCPRQFTIS